MRILFQLLVPVQGRGWLAPLPAAQVARWAPPWTGRPSIPGPLIPTLTETGAIQTQRLTYHAHLWYVGGNRSPRRKPRHGENVQTPASGPGQESSFSLLSTLEQNSIILGPIVYKT